MMSLTALIVAIGACATSEPGSDDALTKDTSTTAPAESEGKKVPPPSNPPSQSSSTDAGAKDSGTKDSSTSTPADSGTTTGNALDCDPNDPLILIKLFAASNPTPCPCSASECCFQGICLPN